MSKAYNKYLHQLHNLKAEIRTIEAKKTKKKWKSYQKAMIDYIMGTTKKVEFEKNGQKILLDLGDEKKGFMHILIRHYKSNDLEAMDIINIFEIYDRGIKLAKDGVSNEYFDVYLKVSNQKQLKLVLNPLDTNLWVVTAYKKS